MKRDKIESFTDLFERALLNDEKHFLYQFITGHTMIEFLLLKIVGIKEPNLSTYSESLTHRNLIELTFGLNLITKDMKDVLVDINKMRNKLAHDIMYMPSIEEFNNLVSKAIIAFADITDGLIQTQEQLKDINCLSELESWGFYDFFIQISYDLHDIYIELGGDHEEFNLGNINNGAN